MESTEPTHRGPQAGDGVAATGSGGVGVRHTEYLLRKAPPSSLGSPSGHAQASSTAATGPLKEKFVSIYEQIFYQGIEGVVPTTEGNSTFWEELFLLRVNAPFLERCIILTGEEQLLQMRTTLQAIFTNACLHLNDQSKIRVAHALETLCVLMRSLFRKKFSSFGVSALVVLSTEQTAREQFMELLSTLNSIILGREDMPSLEPFRRLALTALVILATATEQINQNPFLPYFMEVNLFDLLIQLLASKDSSMVSDALLLLAILLTYRGENPIENWNSANSYRACLREIAHSQAQVIMGALADSLESLNHTYRELLSDQKQSSSVISRWTGFLSGWFSTQTEDPYAKISDYQTGATLLVMYHFVNLAPRCFDLHDDRRGSNATISSMLQSKERQITELDLDFDNDDDDDTEDEGGDSEVLVNDGSTEKPSDRQLDSDREPIDGSTAEINRDTPLPASSPLIGSSADSSSVNQNPVTSETSSTTSQTLEVPQILSTQSTVSDMNSTDQGPPDTLVKFISFVAYLLPDMRNQRQSEYGRVCLNTVLRLTEHHGVNRILHDPKLTATLPLYRKTSTTKSLSTKNQSLACALMDIMICIMRSNLKRQLPSHIFCPCLNVIRRLVIHQKSEGICLENYNWNDLWTCLLSLVKIIISSERGTMGERRMSIDRLEDTDAPEAEVVSENLLVAEQLVILLNIFITFGPRIFRSIELSPPSAPGSAASSMSSSFSTLPAAPAPSSSPSSPSASSSDVPSLASLSSQKSSGYGSFASAPQPLYRTLPAVNIPAYFQLFYEIIHNSSLFRNFVEWAAQRSPVLMHRLDNVSNIIIHFTAKVDEWYVDHPEQTLFAEQVMHIIQENYPTLCLASTSELSSDKVPLYKDTDEEEERISKLMKALIFDHRAKLLVTTIPEAVLTTPLPSPRDHVAS